MPVGVRGWGRKCLWLATPQATRLATPLASPSPLEKGEGKNLSGKRRGSVDILKALAKALGAPLDVIAGA